MYNILITIPMEEIHLDRLKAVCPDASYTIVSPREVTIEMAHSADIILGNVSPALIRGSEKLKWIQLNSAGTDGYTTPGVLPEGCILTTGVNLPISRLLYQQVRREYMAYLFTGTEE